MVFDEVVEVWILPRVEADVGGAAPAAADVGGAAPAAADVGGAASTKSPGAGL